MMPPSPSADALIAAATRLADLLARENAALEAVDLAGAGRLAGEKAHVAEVFVQCQNEVASPSAVQRIALRDLGAQLSQLAQANRILLEREIIVQARVIGSLARAVPRAFAPARYGASGSPAAVGSLPAVALMARA